MENRELINSVGDSDTIKIVGERCFLLLDSPPTTEYEEVGKPQTPDYGHPALNLWTLFFFRPSCEDRRGGHAAKGGLPGRHIIFIICIHAVRTFESPRIIQC